MRRAHRVSFRGGGVGAPHQVPKTFNLNFNTRAGKICRVENNIHRALRASEGSTEVRPESQGVYGCELDPVRSGEGGQKQ